MQATNVFRSDKLSDAGQKIIIALDVDSAVEARSVVDELGDNVGAYKIGLRLFTAEGPKFVNELTQKGIRVFLDLKYHDIPNTVAQAAVEASKLGVWMFNIHASGGAEMMKMTSDSVGEFCVKKSLVKPHIIAVTVLTSSNNETLNSIGIANSVEDQVISLARLASNCGLSGVVASAKETSMIRQSVEKDFLIVTPGIRPTFATNDDQKRVMTPKEAILTGSDHIVIGRPVINADDRSEALKNLIDELES